jgi:YVTN family beta-propeller protein
MSPSTKSNAQRTRRLLIGCAAAVGAIAVAAGAVAGGALVAGPRPDGTGVTPNGWLVDPAGTQVQVGGRPYGLALSPDGGKVLLSNDHQGTQSLMAVDTSTRTVTQTIPYSSPQALYLGVVYTPDGTRAFASAGGNNKIRTYTVAADGALTETASIPLAAGSYPGGLAISSDGTRLYVANDLGGSVSIVDTASGTVSSTTPTGPNPYTVELSKNGAKAYVSNWGGNTVSVVNAVTGASAGSITVGTHPNALAVNPVNGDLYVANGDSDSVSVVDTGTDTVSRTIDLAPYEGAPVGTSPNALAVAPDGNTLYVADAGDNDVAVVDLSAGTVSGLIPTGWYPTGIAISADGAELYVANAKGLGAGPNPNGPTPYHGSPESQYSASMIKGTLSIVDVPKNAGQLQKLTEQVMRNDDFGKGVSVRGTDVGTKVVPRRVGDPSPIKHVIYVIKENRTYDQVFGSLGKGNGDPSLNLFGDDSAPNARTLEREFVTLDNLYANAEVSADGWSWSTEAEANTYNQKNWPANYSGRGRPYDFEGDNLANAAGRDPNNSYLWDRLYRAGISFRNYGFWVLFGVSPATPEPSEPELAGNTDPLYAGYNTAITDQTRIDEWLREFHNYEASGTLPTVELVRLPNDHTVGTTPGRPTPKAMVADNDLALGKLVDAVSHSQFWASTAIFVIEDDAQNGPDHVDAHRTLAQVISPYSHTGRVDSNFYSTVSMLRTMELILGLPPLTQFDASATPMIDSFTNKPDLAPYDAITPAQSLTEVNTVSAPLAAESARMDLADADRAPEQQLNEAIWQSVRGPNSTMPAPTHAFGTLDHG